MMDNNHLEIKLKQAMTQLNQIIVGKSEAVKLAMSAVLARGHLLIEDLPGVGKTTLAKAFAVTLGLDFKRIQFTSDLLPSDIVGFMMPNRDTGKFEFQYGPIFSQLLLADEINRASAKSQSALLEGMEERQVSVEGETRPLSQLFTVFATQNPQEELGTFPLPESQLDRFLLSISMGYLPKEIEVKVLLNQAGDLSFDNTQLILSAEDVLILQTHVDAVLVSPTLALYVQSLLEYTRSSGDFSYGLSTRAGIALIRAAKAYAYLSSERTVLPEHVQAVFFAVANHRLKSKFIDAQAHQKAIFSIIENVKVPF